MAYVIKHHGKYKLLYLDDDDYKRMYDSIKSHNYKCDTEDEYKIFNVSFGNCSAHDFFKKVESKLNIAS